MRIGRQDEATERSTGRRTRSGSRGRSNGLEPLVEIDKAAPLTYAVNRRGDGYEVKFWVPLDQGEKLLKLNQALNWTLVLKLFRKRYSKSRQTDEGDDSGSG